MKYIYSGKQIKALINMPVKTVHTETAKHAYKSILDHYGTIGEESHYYHAGRGHWLKGSSVTGHRKFTTEMLKQHVELVKRKTEKVVKEKKGKELKVSLVSKGGLTVEQKTKYRKELNYVDDLLFKNNVYESKQRFMSLYKHIHPSSSANAINTAYLTYMSSTPQTRNKLQKAVSIEKALISNRLKEAEDEYITQNREDTARSLFIDAYIKQLPYIDQKTALNKTIEAFKKWRQSHKISSKFSQIKAPSKPIKRGEKAAIKGSNKPVMKHTKPKINPANLKSQAKPTPRTKKVQPKVKGRLVVKRDYALRVGFSWSNAHGAKFKIVDIKDVKGEKMYGFTRTDRESKTYYQNEKDISFGISMDRRSFKLEKESKEREAARKLIEEKDNQKKADEYNKLISGLDGFEKQFKPMQKPRVLEVLNKISKFDGKLMKNKDYIRDKVKSGWVVENRKWYVEGRKVNGERKGTYHSGRTLSNGNEFNTSLTKIELDFAEYLHKTMR